MQAALTASDLQFQALPELDRALVGTFAFGLIYADGRIRNLEPAQINALAIAVFSDVFGYDPEMSAKAVDECIRAASPGYHDTMNAIIHRGIDGHHQLQNGDLAGLSDNLNSILAHFKGGA